ncbi:MAG: PIN domain-containing protein [Anaerolineaceae bacterium]|nr:PIN domain-containing protein [Anaerolineaceae bacterium]
MADALVDANFLIALAYPKDNNHAKAIQFASSTTLNLIVPDVVLPEVMYILRRVGGTTAALHFGRILIAQVAPLLALTLIDFERAVAIMRAYQDAELDFVDSCLTALAERLHITHICTFDRRDFSIIRPAHISYFELLP